jgi:hypothetical protein
MTSLRPSSISSIGISKLWERPDAQFGAADFEAGRLPRAILVADAEFVTRESIGNAIRDANPSISVV